jgi:hypothetical protein
MDARSIEAAVQPILQTLRSRRYPLFDEKETQRAIAAAFAEDGIVVERERRLGTGDIIDFVAGAFAIEVKVKGQKTAIYRQLARYAKRPEIEAIVLASNLAMGLPQVIEGKPAFFVHLGKAWL